MYFFVGKFLHLECLPHLFIFDDGALHGIIILIIPRMQLQKSIPSLLLIINPPPHILLSLMNQHLFPLPPHRLFLPHIISYFIIIQLSPIDHRHQYLILQLFSLQFLVGTRMFLLEVGHIIDHLLCLQLDLLSFYVGLHIFFTDP